MKTEQNTTERKARAKRPALILAAILIVSFILPSCGRGGLDPKNPITLTMWHNFGGESQKEMNALLDEFNSTEGKGRGIIINVTAVTSSAEMADTLAMVASEDPGAPDMPDLAVCYPKTAILFQRQGKLANLDKYFSEQELSGYVPSFIAEGRFGDGGLYVFPFAKSTEVLYVNKTLFGRFSAEIGVSEDCFLTFEGICEASRKYFEWSGGKQFFAADSWLNLAQTAMVSLGDSLFENSQLNLTGENYRRIWESFYDPCVLGGSALYRGYSSDLSMTGDLICSVGSSAGINFYGDSITYPDNRTETVEFEILPYPVFSGGQKTVLQRGSGFFVAASEDKRREEAAAIFLKWFTEPDRNTRFVTSTGYMPVSNAAYGDYLRESAANSANPNAAKLMDTFMALRADYVFYFPEVFGEYEALCKRYESNWLSVLTRQRDLGPGGSDVRKTSREALDEFGGTFKQQ